MMGPQGAGSFEDAWSRRVTEVVQGVVIHIMSRADLPKLKMAAGRSIDKRDILALQKSEKSLSPGKPEPAKRKPEAKRPK